MIIFVGDAPSKKNTDPSIPFVGTQSYKRLLMWIWEMDINITDVYLCNKDKIPLHFNGKYVALGRNAEKVLQMFELPYFYLPHPSGLNRTVNDKRLMSRLFKDCKTFLNE
jgi:uracil-DNA glycosylase